MRWLCYLAVFFALTGVARADDEPKPEDLKKIYSQTLEQLKAAQDRKLELAAENEKLTAQVAELKKQLATANTETARLQQEAEGFAERTFFLRTHYAAWVQFIRENFAIRVRWEFYLNQAGPVGTSQQIRLMDRDWPLVGGE